LNRRAPSPESRTGVGTRPTSDPSMRSDLEEILQREGTRWARSSTDDPVGEVSVRPSDRKVAVHSRPQIRMRLCIRPRRRQSCGATGWLPSYSTTPWLYSANVPYDVQNYYQYWGSSPGTFTHGIGKQVAIYAKLIGERPSLWKPDEKIHVKVGTVTCDDGFVPGKG